MHKLFRFISAIVLVLLSPNTTQAQETAISEDKLESIANELFQNEDFVDAYPLYFKLQSKHPKEAEYTYRLGVCTLFALENKEKAIPILKSVVNNPDVDREVHYYLGKAYMLNYKYSDAIVQFNLYREEGNPDNFKRFEIDRQVEMCTNGIITTPKITEWDVKDKKNVAHDNLLNAYDTKSIKGRLFVKPATDFYKTELDYIYEQQMTTAYERDSSEIYVSSYGDKEEGRGKDIFIIKQLPNGDWADAQPLSTVINTKYDEDFPFLLPDGNTLFFSSKGHNSIGGYDIFKTVFNERTNSWSEPENMGVPINSPDDDILFVTDSTETEAYYATAQNNSSDKLFVYKLQNKNKHKDVVFINGFVRQNKPTDVEIEVIDLKDCSIVGVFKANKKNGKYFILLPIEGKYLLKVKSPDFRTQFKIVQANQAGADMVYQEINYDLPNNSKLHITMSSDGQQTIDNVASSNSGSTKNNTVEISDVPENTDPCSQLSAGGKQIKSTKKTKSKNNSTPTGADNTTNNPSPFNEERILEKQEENVAPSSSETKNNTIKSLPSDNTIVYSVQVGLYSKPTPASVFLNIQPLYSKKRPDDKIIYCVGAYNNLLKAEEAKSIIRQLGLTDAFVIAFNNSQQIPVATEDNSWKRGTTAGALLNQLQISKNNLPPPMPKDTGLFYTIQTGIYSYPIHDSVFLNIKPLYSESELGGKIRYSIGIYNSITLAQNAKRIINEFGITNIFVTAIYKNERISIENAKIYEAQSSRILSSRRNMNVMPFINKK